MTVRFYEGECDWLFGLVDQEFHRRGKGPCLSDGLSFRTPDGLEYHLGQLLAQARPRPHEDWPRLVQGWAAAVWDQDADMRFDPSRLVLRFARAGQLEQAVDPLARPLPGVVAMWAEDGDDAVRYGPAFSRVSHIANPVAVALNNLAALHAPKLQRTALDRPDASVNFYYAALEDDSLVASRLLVVERLLGHEIPPTGVFVAVPDTHALLVHVPSGPGVTEALTTMLTTTGNLIRKFGQPVSEHVHLVLPDRRAMVAAWLHDRQPMVADTPHVQHAIRVVGGDPEGAGLRMAPSPLEERLGFGVLR